MLMIGRLMFGKRSIGRRASATKPRIVIPSDAIRTAMAFLSARNVIHMLLLHLRADLLALAHELLAVDDDRLAPLEPLRHLDERALGGARRDRAPTDDAARVDDEDDRDLALVGDGLARDEDRARMAVDQKLDARVHAGLELKIRVGDLHLHAE